jgi:hypothetical protein
MIKIIIIIVGIEWDNIEIVSHLGINPESGGIPLKDNKVNGINNWVNGSILIDLVDAFLEFIFSIFILIKNGIIIKEYIKK